MLKLDSIYSETINHLHRVSPGHYELVEPHLLYLNTKQADQYLTNVMGNSNYRDEGFHDDLIGLVKENARQICLHLRNYRKRFELVDLGPGYPDKTLPILQAAFGLAMQEICYMPVDVSDKYLAIAARAACREAPGATIMPEKTKFEDLTPARFAKRGLVEPNIFLGLTYMNFQGATIGAMLRNMAVPTGSVMVATELLTPTNTPEKATSRYKAKEVVRFTFGPLANLGYMFGDFESEVRYNSALNRVEIAFTYIKPSPIDIIGGQFKKGDKITAFVSYRYTPDRFDQALAPFFLRRDIHIAPSGNTALAVCYI